MKKNCHTYKSCDLKVFTFLYFMFEKKKTNNKVKIKPFFGFGFATGMTGTAAGASL